MPDEIAARAREFREEHEIEMEVWTDGGFHRCMAAFARSEVIRELSENAEWAHCSGPIDERLLRARIAELKGEK